MTVNNRNVDVDRSCEANHQLGLKHASARSAMWMGSSSLITQFLAMGTTAVLAHMLAPSVFGLLAMALTAVNLASLLADMGLARALIQREDLEQHYLSTAFWANMGVTLALGGLVLVVAPLAADFFGEPIVRPVVMALGLSFFLSSLGAVHTAILQKQMSFGALSIIQVVAQVAYSVVVILLALRGEGVWALVVGFLVRASVASVLPWLVCSWKPKLMFDWQAFRHLFGFGGNLMGLRMVMYLRNNLGTAIIGKALGASSLGFYNLAFSLSFIPGNRFAAVLNRVLFPAFSSIQNENLRLRSAYLRAVKYVTTLTFPVSVGIIVVAPGLLEVVYGSRGLAALIRRQIMGLGGMLNALPALNGGVLEAKGRPDLELKLALVSLPVYLMLIALGLRYDLTGVAVATLVSKLIFVTAGATLACVVMKIPARAYFSAISHSALASVVMGLAVLIWRMIALYELGLSNPLVLCSSVVFGGGVSLLVYWVMGESTPLEILQLCWASVCPHRSSVQTTLPS